MKIELHEIPLREVTQGYIDHADEGVVGYGGRLNIRPKYQREFIYDEKRRNAVVDSIRKGFPLNVMYWAKNEDGSLEVLDGQQRTISFCQYVNGDFSIDSMAFHNLTKTEQEQILNYSLMIYFCEGNDIEKLNWFRIVNIGGLKLNDQELRNAVYTGPWLSDAKAKFSRRGAAGYLLGKEYVTGDPTRQEFLETAIRWISDDKIRDYMSVHQHDPNANELWLHFRNVIEWVKLTFPKYRKEMKSVDWGPLHKEFGSKMFDTVELEKRVLALMRDDEVTVKKGVYPYVLTGDEKELSIRAFTDSQKRTAYEQQEGKCYVCGEHFEIEGMEADHITPWSRGGKTIPDNCKMLCKACNRLKTNV